MDTVAPNAPGACNVRTEFHQVFPSTTRIVMIQMLQLPLSQFGTEMLMGMDMEEVMLPPLVVPSPQAMLVIIMIVMTGMVQWYLTQYGTEMLMEMATGQALARLVHAISPLAMWAMQVIITMALVP